MTCGVGFSTRDSTVVLSLPLPNIPVSDLSSVQCHLWDVPAQILQLWLLMTELGTGQVIITYRNFFRTNEHQYLSSSVPLGISR